MMLRPEDAVRGWIGASAASKEGTQTITRAFGVRDLALGAGALAALNSGSARDWVIAGAVCDAVDLAATVQADDIPSSGRVLVVLMASAAMGVSAAYLVAGAGEG